MFAPTPPGPTSPATHTDREPRRIRVVARVLIPRPDDGRLLVVRAYDRMQHEHFYIPLGGGLRFGESAEHAIRREVREEVGQELEHLRLLTVLENQFVHEGEPGHEVVFVFAASFADEELYAREALIVIDGDGETLEGSWEPIGAFRSENRPDLPPLYPAPLERWLETNLGAALAAPGADHHPAGAPG